MSALPHVTIWTSSPKSSVCVLPTGPRSILAHRETLLEAINRYLWRMVCLQVLHVSILLMTPVLLRFLYDFVCRMNFICRVHPNFTVSTGDVPERRILRNDYFQRHQGWEHKAHGRMAAPSGSNCASGRVRRCEALQPFWKA